MDDGLRGIFLVAAIVGFALALGWTMNELDVALKDACASLGTIATIGD